MSADKHRGRERRLYWLAQAAGGSYPPKKIPKDLQRLLDEGLVVLHRYPRWRGIARKVLHLPDSPCGVRGCRPILPASPQQN